MIEPPVCRDLARLHPAFRSKLERVLFSMERAGLPFRAVETWRSADRQAWHYAKGRTIPGPDVSPERPLGRTVTSCDGVRRVSQHQRGLAADVYPVRPDGRVWIPPAEHELWLLLGTQAHAVGLRHGREWNDCPHLQWAGTPPVESAAQREMGT
jgi:hypothetical protein